jgi:hypothetical protein
VKNILRVWFALCKPYTSQPWCNYPRILEKDEFYANAKVILLTEAQNLGKKIDAVDPALRSDLILRCFLSLFNTLVYFLL